MEPKLINERILVLIPDRDSPPKKDYTHVFLPEAVALQSALGATVEKIRVPVVDAKTLTIASREKQRAFEEAADLSIAAIEKGPWTRIIFMCHGWDVGLQLGFRCARQKGNDRQKMDGLISALKRQSKLRSITLFACSAGDEPASAKSSPGTGDDSFADYLRDKVGCAVVAHWTTGHATRNPDLIFFAAGSGPMIGGVAWPPRGKAAYRNAIKLLSLTKQGNVIPGKIPPKGHHRAAFTNIPLCNTVEDLQALLSSEPNL
jgi:hypothetical protein